MTTHPPFAEHWKHEPEEHDYPAAADYLSLLFSDSDTAAIVSLLRNAPLSARKAKDLLRASRLELLPATDPSVVKDLTKVVQGRKLSPILLVRVGGGAPLVVADGYHRICASYQLDENAVIPCRIAEHQAKVHSDLGDR
jgi:hypothetical protein